MEQRRSLVLRSTRIGRFLYIGQLRLDELGGSFQQIALSLLIFAFQILFLVTWYLIYCAMSRLPLFFGDSDFLDDTPSSVADEPSLATLPPCMHLEDDNFSKHSLTSDLGPKSALEKLRAMGSMDTFAPAVSTSIASDTSSTKRTQPLRKSAIESLFDRLLVSNGRITTTKRHSHTLPAVNAATSSDDLDTPTQSPRTPKPEAYHPSWIGHSGSSPQSRPADDEEEDELTPKATDHIPSSLIHPLGGASVMSSEHQSEKDTSVVDRLQQAIDMRMQAIRAVKTRKQARSFPLVADRKDVSPSTPPPTPPLRPSAESLLHIVPSINSCKRIESTSMDDGLSASMWARDARSKIEDRSTTMHTDSESADGTPPYLIPLLHILTENLLGRFKDSHSLDTAKNHTIHRMPSSGSHYRSHSDTAVAQASARDVQEEEYTSGPRNTPRRRTLPSKLSSQAMGSEADGCTQRDPPPGEAKPAQPRQSAIKHGRTKSEANASSRTPNYMALCPTSQHTLGHGSVVGQGLSHGGAERQEFFIPPLVTSAGHTSEPVSPLFDISQYNRKRDLAQTIDLHPAQVSLPTYSDPEYGRATEVPLFEFPSIASPLVAPSDCATPPQQFAPVSTSSPQRHGPSTPRDRSLSPGSYAPPPSTSELGARPLSGGVYLCLQGRRPSSLKVSARQEDSGYATKTPPSTPLMPFSVNHVVKPSPSTGTSSHTRISTIDWAMDEPEPVGQRKKHTRGKRGGKRTKKSVPVGEVNWALA